MNQKGELGVKLSLYAMFRNVNLYYEINTRWALSLSVNSGTHLKTRKA